MLCGSSICKPCCIAGGGTLSAFAGGRGPTDLRIAPRVRSAAASAALCVDRRAPLAAGAGAMRGAAGRMRSRSYISRKC